MSIILSLRRPDKFKASLGYISEFPASLGYIHIKTVTQ